MKGVNMKVIGLKNRDNYIVEVSHTELEKVFDKYYNNLPRLSVGDVINLEDGYDFRSDIKDACGKMVEAVKGFDERRNSLLKFATLVAGLHGED